MEISFKHNSGITDFKQNKRKLGYHLNMAIKIISFSGWREGSVGQSNFYLRWDSPLACFFYLA